MFRRTAPCCLLACLLLTGCMPKMTMEELQAMKPQRPPELDHLNAFVGRWEWTGEAKMAGLDEVLKTSGHSEGKWEGGGWYVVSRGKMTMGGFGEMDLLEAWTYDSHCKKFRSTWVDSTGSLGTGVSTFDEKTNTWHMKAVSHGPWGKSTGKGTMTLIGDDKMEWEWSEYAMGGLIKTMEMTGSGKKVR